MTGTVIVAGATGGLGPAVVHRLLEEGRRVVAPFRSKQGMQRLGSDERLVPVQVAVLDERGAAEVVAAAGDDLTGVVNLVGGFAQGGRVHETPLEQFVGQLEDHVHPVYALTSSALPVLLARPGPSRGAVVCVSSRAALQPFSGAAGYITGKAAVLGFVDALDAEYRQDGIRVNAILPSVIDTPANRAAMPGADFSRWVAPEKIASVIWQLIAEDGNAITGSRVKVYGRA